MTQYEERAASAAQENSFDDLDMLDGLIADLEKHPNNIKAFSMTMDGQFLSKELSIIVYYEDYIGEFALKAINKSPYRIYSIEMKNKC